MHLASVLSILGSRMSESQSEKVGNGSEIADGGNAQHQFVRPGFLAYDAAKNQLRHQGQQTLHLKVLLTTRVVHLDFHPKTHQVKSSMKVA